MWKACEVCIRGARPTTMGLPVRASSRAPTVCPPPPAEGCAEGKCEGVGGRRGVCPVGPRSSRGESNDVRGVNSQCGSLWLMHQQQAPCSEGRACGSTDVTLLHSVVSAFQVMGTNLYAHCTYGAVLLLSPGGVQRKRIRFHPRVRLHSTPSLLALARQPCQRPCEKK